MSFSFSFSGDDIEEDKHTDIGSTTEQVSSSTAKPTSSAFPVPGKSQLRPTHHDLPGLLADLPSKIAFGFLDLTLDDGSLLQIPRRELWDVRVQLMAEDEDGNTEGLGEHDVKTGVYEGGFKSWESSVDLVKTLAAGEYLGNSTDEPTRVIELGCGTALPSLALLCWAFKKSRPVSFIAADYNPTVLQLVTLPNMILSWSMCNHDLPVVQEALNMEDELELTPELLKAFQTSLAERHITLSFVSGGWSDDFVNLVQGLIPQSHADHGKPSHSTLIIGAETIYSPFALQAFTETVLSVMRCEPAAEALVGAKKLYFGVGGSLDDFTELVREKGAGVTQLREEADGVRRGVVLCSVENTNTATN